MIIKVFILGMLLGVCPPVIGCIFTGHTKNSRGNLAAAYLYGLVTMLTGFEALAVPMCFRHMTLTMLTRTYLCLLAVLVVISVIRNRGLFLEQWRWLFAQRKKLTPVLLAAMACMMLQGGYVTVEQHIDDDDAFYLATATTSVTTDSLYKYSAYTGKKYRRAEFGGLLRYVTASWPIFIAFLSKCSHMHATIIAHMFLPAVVLFWVYLIYFLYGNYLFPDNRHKFGLFLLFITVLLTFSGFSIYSAGVFALIRGWQGKAVLAGAILPAVLYNSILAMQEEKLTMQWLMLFMSVGAAVTLSSMGVVLAGVVVGAYALVRTLQTKRFRYLLNGILVCTPCIACAMLCLMQVLIYR